MTLSKMVSMFLKKNNLRFGDEILQIVKANSKNESIEDVQKKKKDLIDCCILMGEGALIVKAGDIIDNFFYYNMTKNSEEIMNHCMPLAKLLLKKKPENFTDDIFDRLKVVLNGNNIL